MCPGMVATPEIAEAEWDLWLFTLQPWEMHWLLQGDRELYYHDQFVAGACTLADIGGVIAEDHSGKTTA